MTMHVAVAGAGAFGVWPALALRERGCEVTLLEAYGPGNSASSSGGDTRVVRGFHGGDTFYAGWGLRALDAWAKRERDWDIELVRRVGFLWLQHEGTPGGYDSAALLEDHGQVAELLTPDALSKRYPQIESHDIAWAVLEPAAGYVRARFACQRACAAFEALGGRHVRAEVTPPAGGGQALASLAGTRGETIEADAYVFACGPWFPDLFPELLGDVLTVTRQEAYYFKEPGGENLYSEKALPAWTVIADEIFYGVPGNDHRGFKIADDQPGDPFHPGTGERIPRPSGLHKVRNELARRFPGMAAAPVSEARVCQYTRTPDDDFIVDRHPQWQNVWLAGCGNGRGFKHGPVMGEHVASLILDGAPPEARFALSRLAATP